MASLKYYSDLQDSDHFSELDIRHIIENITCSHRLVNFSDPAEKAAHDKMVSLVERMLELHRRCCRAPRRKKKCSSGRSSSTDQAIDQLVYKLYGLTEEEIRIVESGA